MAGRGVADVVFCLDVSGSMQPCIDGLRTHIVDFVRSLTSSGQVRWDLRLDYLAHWTDRNSSGQTVFGMSSLRHDIVTDALYPTPQDSTFFTSDVAEFQAGLAKLDAAGDEATLIALDTALDYPWRTSHDCHRVVVCLTDEPIEDGLCVGEQITAIPKMIAKLQRLKIMLFLVAPQSAALDQLCEVDRSEYRVIDPSGANRGMATLDFKEVLGYIGKSISVSQPQQTAPAAVERSLFGQANWSRGTAERRGS